MVPQNNNGVMIPDERNQAPRAQYRAALRRDFPVGQSPHDSPWRSSRPALYLRCSMPGEGMQGALKRNHSNNDAKEQPQPQSRADKSTSQLSLRASAVAASFGKIRRAFCSGP